MRPPLAAKRQLEFVPDDPALFEALTVWEHLEFTAAAYRGAESRECLDQADMLRVEWSFMC